MVVGRAGFQDGRSEAAESIEWCHGERIRDEWRQLFERCPDSDIRLHPDVALASTPTPPTVLARRAGAALEEAFVLAPRRVRLSGGPGGHMLSLRGLQIVGERILATEARRDPVPLLDAALGLLRTGAADCLFFEELPVGSPLWTRLHALPASTALAYHPKPPQPHWWIRFPDTAASATDRELYWRSQFPGARRRKLRNMVRRLEHTVRRYTRPDEVPELLGKAHEVSERSWQARRFGLRIRNDEGERRRLQALAHRGALRSYVLEHGRRPVAFVMGVQWAGRFLYDEVGFDGELRSRSPGTVLLVRAIEDLLREATPRVVDFGAGDGAQKRQFGNLRSESGPLVVAAPGRRSSLMLRLGDAHRRLDDGARHFLRRTGLYEQARRLYHR